MVEDGLPRWKVGGEIAPWAAGAQHVEDRIENGPQRVNWRSATFGQGREITLQALPLRIRKIAGITCTHLSSLSCEAISAINKTRSQKWEASGQAKRGSGKHYPKAKVWGLVRATARAALTIQVNCTCPLAQPVEKSVDWDWSLRSRLVQGRYDRQAVPHST